MSNLHPADLLTLVAITAAVFATAQTIPFVVKWSHGPWRDAPDSTSWMTYVGATLLVVASVAAWLASVDVLARSLTFLAWTVPALLAGLLLFAAGRARRLRLAVEALGPDGTRSEVASAYVVNRLGTLGAHKPRGVLDPRGTDVSSLPEEALGTAPEGKVAAALLKILRVVVSITPWSARVVQVDEETVTVELSHLWRQVESTVIFRSELGLPSLDAGEENAGNEGSCRRDLLTAAAAFILIRLSETHTALQNGLCGVTKWRSLACHVLASAPPWEGDAPTRAELLARAVEKDPGNYAAWSSYFRLRSGDDVIGSVENEERYAARLRSLSRKIEEVRAGLPTADAKRGYSALLMRIAYSLAAAHLNIVAHLQITNPQCRNRLGCKCSRELDLANEAARKLSALIKEVRDDADRRTQAGSDKLLTFTNEEMAPSFHQLRTYIDYCVAAREAQTESATADARVRALAALQQPRFIGLCHIYNRAAIETQLGDKESALQDLDLALGYRKLHDAAFSDPYFTDLYRDTTFAELTNGHQTLESLDAIRPHAEKLQRDGISLPGDLVNRHDLTDLAKSLDVPVATVTWIREICKLVQSCPQTHRAISWTNLLVAEGVESRDQLRAELRVATEPALVDRLSKRALQCHVSPPDREDLESWARGRFSRILAHDRQRVSAAVAVLGGKPAPSSASVRQPAGSGTDQTGRALMVTDLRDG